MARNSRLKRAMDLSMKHTKLEGSLREAQTPFDSYMQVRALVVAIGGQDREPGRSHCGVFAVFIDGAAMLYSLILELQRALLAGGYSCWATN